MPNAAVAAAAELCRSDGDRDGFGHRLNMHGEAGCELLHLGENDARRRPGIGGAHVKGHGLRVALAKREVERGGDGFAQRPILAVADHANDLERPPVVHDLFSERVAIPKPSRQRFVHDRDARRPVTIVPAEVATGEERYPNGAEPAGRGLLANTLFWSITHRGVGDGGVDFCSTPAWAKRDDVREAGRLDGSRVADALLKRRQDLRVFAPAPVERHGRQQHAGGVETRIDVLDAFEAADEQSTPEQQRRRHGDLRADELATHRLPRAVDTAVVGLERRHDVKPRRSARRRQTKHDGSERRQTERVCEHLSVHLHVHVPAEG